ncbi:MAG: hypothetical protein ACTSO9_08905 [Candidatus Helarchaeota archaeon]
MSEGEQEIQRLLDELKSSNLKDRMIAQRVLFEEGVNYVEF